MLVVIAISLLIGIYQQLASGGSQACMPGSVCAFEQPQSLADRSPTESVEGSPALLSSRATLSPPVR